MCLLLTWICLGFQTVLCNNNDIASAPSLTGRQNEEFAKALQQDLRRHIGVYSYDTVNASHHPGEHFATAAHHFNVISVSRAASARPSDLEEDDSETTPDTERIQTSTERMQFYTITPRKHLKLTSPSFNVDATKHDKISNRYPKYVNKDKVNKLMMFLDKNRDRVKDFISMKGDTGALREGKTADMRAVEEAPRTPPAPSGPAGAVHRARSEERPALPPSAVQLDMAPAKGGRIHSLRVKNRLCHRHVLVPEGPKYDSGGHVYLGPHAARAAGRDYARTRRPALLLPRCCNCCKKSLLGCE